MITDITTAIRAIGLTKTYGSLTAVDRLDLDVPDGQVLALLGPNGAGKSTTTEMILGLTKPDAGSIEVFGATPSQSVRAGRVGAMLQNGALLADMSVRSLLGMVHGIHITPLSLDAVIDRADLGDFLRTSTSKLSGGQAQRVRFALAIMGNPDLILLDEPTVGMDVDARRRFWHSISDLADHGKTVIFATHYLEEADLYADRIVVVNAGRVVADGTGSEIKATVGGRHITFAGPDRNWSSYPAVLTSGTEGARHLVVSRDSDATLRAILADPDVHDVEVTTPSLEDAFLELVA